MSDLFNLRGRRVLLSADTCELALHSDTFPFLQKFKLLQRQVTLLSASLHGREPLRAAVEIARALRRCRREARAREQRQDNDVLRHNARLGGTQEGEVR